MLFTKEINSISYEDVQDFCKENHKGNEFLEYKSDFTPSLDKEISSMANTYGGTIIIGVHDDDGYPRPPFEGIEYKKRYQERITQIALYIYPPIIPEIRVCPPKNKNTFIVIRVPESDLTPHYIRKEKAQAYVRTGIINNPAKIADVNEIDWLKKKREKSIELRQHLFSCATDHFFNVADLARIPIFKSAEQSVKICPLFPSKQFIEPEEIEKIFIEHNARPFLIPGRSKPFPTENGWASISRIDEEEYCYLEISVYGLVNHVKGIQWHFHHDIENKNGIDVTTLVTEKRRRFIQLENIVDTLIALLNFTNSYFAKIGFMGLCIYEYHLRKVLNIGISHFFQGRPILYPDAISIIDELNFSEKISTWDLKETDFRTDFLLNVIRKITWSLGSEYDPGIPVNNILRGYISPRVK